jgi:site-specific DNA recombinase
LTGGAFAAQQGWTVDGRFIFKDDGVSGAEFERRPGFVALMDALRPTPPFTALIMSEESRLGRNTNEVPYAIGRLVKAGVEVWCYRDRRRISLDTPIEKFMVTATSFAADMERWLAQQRSVETMLRKARAGHVTGGRVFGYDNVRKDGHVERVVKDAEAEVVREIFQRYADGEGFKHIAHALNARRLPALVRSVVAPQGGTPVRCARCSGGRCIAA